MRIGIVGGGIIGLALGWRLRREGLEVVVFERDRAGARTSYVGAGMLAPYAEVGFEELPLMRLGEQSLNLFPAFLDRLAEDAGRVPRLDRCGTLMVGVDRDDTEHLRRLYDFRRELGLPVEMITGTEAREREPLLAPRVVSAIWLPDDAQIDNRLLVAALREAFLRRGGRLLEGTAVQRVLVEGDRVRGVQTAAETHPLDAVVVAAGCWSGQVPGLPEALRPPVRPVKGQILTLGVDPACRLTRMIRSPRVYLVPKEEGTIRLGATTEEKGFDTEPTAGAVKELLEDAWEVVPCIYDLPVREVLAGLRPASRDHAPIIGQAGLEGLYYATGHYRNGILLTPVTVENLAAEIVFGTIPESTRPFRPERFQTHPTP
ncbi:glycine oxidase ThiO [Rhodocaloribacter litoris]|uniref:glycine oxidase ThiO n=1 Tax=Rhodocaloribacter litoris TaxID=2558931 RepID=UPI001420E893|nr:glycine oxidase ThiO [Rhodocaloribacter litoris]QXD16289.1 glycine oxidase ThiO [Rhodocaloribacter litoris]GIV60891.1 MAG: glycine oxidase ThiO [Rhodothermaceae bacterium]